MLISAPASISRASPGFPGDPNQGKGRRAKTERSEQVALERIVGEAGQHAVAIVFIEAERPGLPRNEMGERAMATGDALRRASRP